MTLIQVKCNSILLSCSLKHKAHGYEINEVLMKCVHAPANSPDISCHSKVDEHKNLAKN